MVSFAFGEASTMRTLDEYDFLLLCANEVHGSDFFLDGFCADIEAASFSEFLVYIFPSVFDNCGSNVEFNFILIFQPLVAPLI